MTERDSTEADLAARIPGAVGHWARTVFGAPRRMETLITGVEICDEVIERVVAHVVRRTVSEVRSATTERRSTQSRLDPRGLDPFAFSKETIRVESQFVAQCDACGASGMARCAECGGSCQMTCGTCHGSTKERNPKTNRLIKCKSCKATGRLPCSRCAGTGSTTCRVCSGSGHQLAWLTFDERDYWVVSISPESPIVVAHRALREERLLDAEEVAAFAVVDEHRNERGPLEASLLTERELARTQLASLDPRLERVRSQQYLKLAVVRRDVTYTMCGTTGTVVLSGRDLAGSTTPEAVRPIKRRLYLLPTLVVAVGLLGAALQRTFVGSSSYFADARLWTSGLVAVSMACAVPVFGTVLRSWRGGVRFSPMRWPTLAASGGASLALAGVVVLGLLVRPSANEVQSALASHDVSSARRAIDAVKEQGGTRRETLDLEDQVMLAEAGKLQGDPRFQILDEVAGRKGTAAAQAATTASTERLDAVRHLVRSKDSAGALAAIDRWFHDDKSPAIVEQRAEAHEVAMAACQTEGCRLGEAVAANSASGTAGRVSEIGVHRARILETLAYEKVDPKPGLPRLRQLRQVAEAGAFTIKSVSDDVEIRKRAQDAIDFADTERAKAPLLRSDMPTVDELLGVSEENQKNVRKVTLDGVSAYLAFDANGRCAGIYAIGNSKSRSFNSATWPAERLLSQALGRAATIRSPSESSATSRWYESGVPVVARWNEGALVELRIGDATP